MHRLLILAVAALAACASTPSGPGEVDALMRALHDPSKEESSPRPEARLAELGDAAIPALKAALADRGDARARERAARALGLMWTEHGHAGALDVYLHAVVGAHNDFHARSLLSQAHRFRDPEARVYALLDTAIQDMRVVTPEMVSAAGAMRDVEATETMMKLVGKTRDAEMSPERDVALRYLGRSARRGRRESAAFLTMCTQSGNSDMMRKAGDELKLLAGGDAPKGWRDWWFEAATGERKAWLAKSFSTVGGKPFDPSERDHIAELMERIPRDADAEPEMWFLEQVLGRSFGYVSPRDVFDPDVDLGDLSAANGRAIATAREWWRENSPYLYFNPATNRFEISEEARRIGVPVDPRTGKPGR